MPTKQLVIRALVVDDHRSYAEALSFALARTEGIESIGCAFSVDEAVSRVQHDEPDIVLLDWQLPDVDGVEGIGRIKAARSATKIILISGHAAGNLERLATSAGASALLPKESSIADIVSTVRRCAEGEVITSTLSTAASEQPVALTRRETEILWLLAKGNDAPHIAAELFISVHTVRGYIKDLRRKFAATSQLQVIAVARAQGLLPD
ncbi:MAG: response regulator transcription factor [Actinobacteria bacterium]|nr:response regulator transcription factor [Actinomycetota bacterium]